MMTVKKVLKRQSVTYAVTPARNTPLKKKSVLCWKARVVKTVWLNYVAGKALILMCTPAGQRSLWRPVKSV